VRSTGHYEQWATKNMFVVEEHGKAVIAHPATDLGAGAS
jgi:hypothetical protein